MPDLRIRKELQSKRAGACRIYSAIYDGRRCYAIIHALSEFVMIFEDSGVYRELVKKLRSNWRIYFTRRTNGIPAYSLWKSGNKPIELTRFIAAKYDGRSPEDYAGFVVKAFDDMRRTDNFLDFRRYNVSLPGFDLRHRDDIDYQCDENYIYITFKDAKNPIQHTIPFEPELDEMLRTPKYCNFWPGENERGNMSVHGGDARCNLGGFLAIYKYNFGGYRGTENPVENFIKDFRKIKCALPEGTQADHLNCNPYIHTLDNLIHVDQELNRAKWSYVNWFAGEYGVHPVLNDADEILFAYKRINLISGEEETCYYKCRTFRDFVDWILLYLGKDTLTEKLQVRYNPMIEDEQTVILTPAGMIVDGIVDRAVAGSNAVTLEEHIEWHDVLLSRPDEAFTIHEAHERTPQYTVDLVLDMLGMNVR